MGHPLPEIGELWTWLSKLDGKHNDPFLIIGQPIPIPKMELMEDYEDPYDVKVMWVDNGETGNLLVDRTDMHLHIQKVS
jgi:hypothetical protein